LGCNGYYARDGGTENGEDGAFAGSDGLKGMGGQVLNQVGVELEAIPGFRRIFLPGTRGVGTGERRGRVRGVPEDGGCWRGKWQLPEPDCLGEWVRSPSGDEREGIFDG